MTLLSDTPLPPSATAGVRAALPKEVEFILSALEAGQFAGPTRRKSARHPYRVGATLKLFSDAPQTSPWQVFVRDIDPKGLGFVTRHRLPLGYGGIVTVPTPEGRIVAIDCTLLRCREAVQGWFEGSMYFNRVQPCFGGEFLT
jgi:hypothetical protein